VTWQPQTLAPPAQTFNTCGIPWSTESSALKGYWFSSVWQQQSVYSDPPVSATPDFQSWAGQTNVTHSGKTAAQCASLANNAEASMQAIVSTATNVSFWWKVSCQTNADYLGFYTNGTLAKKISGEVNWQSNYFRLPAGTNTLVWRYATTNRLNVPQGSNSAWVDQLVFGPTNMLPPRIAYSFTNLILNAGSDCHASLPDLTGPNYIGVVSCSSVTVTQTPPVGTLLPLGATMVVLSAVASSGIARSTNSVFVADTTPPQLACPPDVITNTDPGLQIASQVSLGAPQASDNCSLATVTNNAPSSFPVGTNFVTWVATDQSGNSTTKTQMVVVIAPPVTPQVIVQQLPSLPHKATGIVHNDDGSVTISFQGTGKQIYVIQASANLIDWFPIATNTAAEDGSWSFTDTTAAAAPIRFYRSALP
jgi:hypothetical protein